MADHASRKPKRNKPFHLPGWTEEKYVQMVRGLFSGGSGSGGGNFFADVDDAYDFFKSGALLDFDLLKDAYKWRSETFPGVVQLVYGKDEYGCIGLPTGERMSSIWGSDIRFLVDPSGLFKTWKKSVPSFSTDTSANIKRLLLGNPGGAVNLTLGRNTSLLYGIKRDFHRGPTYELTSQFDAADGLPGKVLAALASVCVFTSIILSDFDFYKDGTSWEVKLAKFGLSNLSGRLLGLMVDYETKLAMATVATDEADAAEAKLALAEEIALQLKPDLLAAAKTDAEEAAKLVVTAADLESNQAADRRLAIDGDFSVRAQNIELIGAPQDSELMGMFDLSIVSINAQGGPGSENGTLILNGSKQGSLTAGPAKVQVVRTVEEGTVIVDAGAIGTVNVQQGLPDLGSRMSLKPTGVGINVGPPVGGSSIQLTDEGISISWGMAPAGASIKLSGDGIVMNYGLCTFSMTAEGITLQAAENRIAVTPAAVQTSALVIENTGQTLGGLAGMMVEINGDGQTSLQAPLMMIG